MSIIYSLLHFCKQIATLRRVGYLPFFPGTIASLIALPLVILIKKILWYKHIPELPFFILITLTCYLVIHQALKLMPHIHDPKQIVLDEVVGCMWAFYGCSLSSIGLWFTGFVLFRFFDIRKPLGIDYCQRFSGAFGILLDDIVAGLYTACVLKIFSL